MAQSIKRSLSWSLVSRALGLGSGFIVTLLLTRLLTLSELGSFYLLLTATQFGSHFIKMGLEVSQQKFLAIALAQQDWQTLKRQQLASLSILSISFALSTCVCLLAWPWFATHYLHSPTLATLTAALVISLAIRTAEELFSAYFRSTQQISIGVFVLDVPRQIFFASCLAWHMLNGQALNLIMAINDFLVAGSLSVLLSLLLALKWWWPLSKQTAALSMSSLRHEIHSIFSLSWPMMLQGIGAIVISSADIWLLGLLASAESLGIYGTAVRLGMLLRTVLVVITLVTPPLMATLYAAHKLNELETLVRKTATWGSLLSLPIILFFICAGDWSLSLLFGPALSTGYAALAILTLGYAADVFFGSPGWLLQIAGQQRLLLQLTLLTACSNLVLNFVLIHYYGIVGAALASALSFLLISASSAYQVKQKLGIKVWPHWRYLRRA